MTRISVWLIAPILCASALLLLFGAAPSADLDKLWHLRNLGKAFYENPTTQKEAVEQFRKALAANPNSVREHINYGLALLKAGETPQGIAELRKAQQQDPSIPHTWFSLGIAAKKDGNNEEAIAQLEQMIKLVPDDAISHYNLAVLYKLTGSQERARAEFLRAIELNPNLAAPHYQLSSFYRQSAKPEDAAREMAAFMELKKRAGSTASEDLESNNYSEIYEIIEPLPVPSAPATLKFVDRSLGTLDAANAGLAAIDVTGQRKADLLAWSSSGIVVSRNGADAAKILPDVRDVVAVIPGDYDNDGLSDLCVLTRTGAALFHNQKGVFTKAEIALPDGPYTTAIWLDYDHDYDLDLFLLGPSPKLMRNNGDGTFTDQTGAFPFAKGNAVAATLFARQLETSARDLVVSYADHSGVLYLDKLNGVFEVLPIDSLPAGATSLVAADFNHDAYIDLIASSAAGLTLIENHRGELRASPNPPAGKGPIAIANLDDRTADDLVAGTTIFRNNVAAPWTLAERTLPSAVAIAAGDFRNTGRDDIALIAGDGTLHLFENETTTRNQFLRVGITGIKNVKLAPGATVEVKAGATYQKKIYTGVPLVFGLASYADADTVRIEWPNGMIQNEPKQLASHTLHFPEAQRMSGSCPMIFTWNGRRFEFVTDVLGVAPLGASSGDGHYFPVDHDEYIQIRGDQLHDVDGNYEIRITEELREVSYLDKVQLIAVDHPANSEVFTNDKFKSPPFPEFRLFGAARRIYPERATDHHGRDVRAALLHRDKVYPDAFARDLSGVAELHRLDLDFGQSAADNRAVLILNGWVDWADGSTFLGASQHTGGGLIFPYLQVQDKGGQWRTVVADMGIPAGKPKTISVDLTGKFLSSSRKVRIVTNLCLYWDEIFLSDNSSTPNVTLTAMDASAADLHYRGFSKPVIHPARLQPENFLYDRRIPLSMWNPTPGLYTRYGDVRELTTAIDDELVVMGSGDELRLLFPATKLPALPSGWTRDFLLLVDGWAKDADANTAYSQSVEPLPFHDMSAYPYRSDEHYPADAAHQVYRKKYLTRPALRLIRPLT